MIREFGQSTFDAVRPDCGRLRRRHRMVSIIWARLQTAYARTQLGREEGQALVEYALILALVSIVAVAALTLIGHNLTAKFNFISSNI
jgi:pilus assembly protein Flp/PilA